MTNCGQLLFDYVDQFFIYWSISAEGRSFIAYDTKSKTQSRNKYKLQTQITNQSED